MKLTLPMFAIVCDCFQLERDRPTDQPTNGRRDKASYRDAWTHLKRNIGLNILVNGDIRFLALVASLEYWIEHSSQWQHPLLYKSYFSEEASAKYWIKQSSQWQHSLPCKISFTRTLD